MFAIVFNCKFTFFCNHVITFLNNAQYSFYKIMVTPKVYNNKVNY